MGYGEVAGNGSVHWKFDHQAGSGKMKCKKARNRPKDDHEITYEDVAMGRDPATPGRFAVELRFESRQDAEDAKARAYIEEESGKFILKLSVNAVKRDDPDKDQPAEIRVRW